jgi:hypothetical protein
MINFKFSNERRVSAMMNTYKDQITNLCIQTYYNLYGVMPDAQELAEMIGEDVATLDEKQAA